MAKKLRQSDKNDAAVEAVYRMLVKVEEELPGAQASVYRFNCVSIRVWIVWEGFRPLDRVDRQESVWHFVEELPESVRSQISILLLQAPGEHTLMTAEFLDPMPSTL